MIVYQIKYHKDFDRDNFAAHLPIIESEKNIVNLFIKV